MPQKFNLLTADHSVRRLRITHTELAASGITATYDNVLDAATWKNALGLEVGAEIEAVGPSWTRHLRVLSVGTEGAVVEHISGQQSVPVARHLFVCRAAPDTEHMYQLIERRGDAPDFTHQHLMPGQSNLRVLVEEVIRILAQGGDLPDVTFGCLDADMVKEGTLSDEDPLMPSWWGKTVLCAEGNDGPADRWNAVIYIPGRGHVAGPRMYCGGATSRFNEKNLGEEILKRFGADRAFGNGEPDFKRFERGRWDDLHIRPNQRWSARAICPDAFPQRPAVPAEAERAAAAKREAFVLSKNPQASRDARSAAQQQALVELEEMTRAKKAGGGAP
jgi:hypothetical protein